MDKIFICLANSYKHNNRCIAGIEIEFYPQLNKYVVKRDQNNNPIWFRPIHRVAEAGAIPNAEAQKLSVLDIVKAHQVVPCPDGAQNENYYYTCLEKISRISKNIQNLDNFINNTHNPLFGNCGAAVPPDMFVRLAYSILLIKCSEVEFYMKDRSLWKKEPQPRGKLSYDGIEYDLPVTDPIFRKVIQNDIMKANSYADYYITISLGVEHDEWHSKLIAGVIPIVGATQTNVPPSQQTPENGISKREDSALITFNLFQQGFSIEQIATKRGLVPGTISTHLTHFIASGELDVRRLVPDEKIHQIIHYKQAHPDEDKLKIYYNAFNGEISYSEIRWVLVALQAGYIQY